MPPENLHDLRGMYVEAAARIITGEASVDTFDDFVETWRKTGGDDVVELMTSQYNERNQ